MTSCPLFSGLVPTEQLSLMPCFLDFCFGVISVESPHMQAVVKDYVELSFDQLPSIMEFLCGLITQEGPVIVYTH